ncbi:MAG: sulfotransferase domain-containing protein [Terriglobales bacterium]
MLVSYPRSGSTWASFLIAELLTGADPTFDAAHAAVPELPDVRHCHSPLGNGGRVVRSHEAWRDEYRSGGVYLVRDPRDVAVSYWRYRCWLGDFGGPLSQFVRIFLGGKVDSYGLWSSHVNSWLSQGGGDALVVRYEDLVSNPERQLSAMAAHLGLRVSTGAVHEAVLHNTRPRMAAKEAAVRGTYFTRTDPASGFVGRGSVGGWKSILSEEAAAAIGDRFGDAMTQVGYI